jgi:hypothetical protein
MIPNLSNYARFFSQGYFIHTTTTTTMTHFKHLEEVDQTYSQHLKDAMKYSWVSFKSSFFFFFHGLVPCLYEHNGSDNVSRLNATIAQKYQDKMDRA